MTTINNEVQKPDDATLILKRVLNATPELVFRAWTTPEHIQQWMRPEPGMVVPSVSMDLRVGGKFRIQMKNPGGEFFTAVGEFREVKAPENFDVDDLVVTSKVHDQPDLDLFRFDHLASPKGEVSGVGLAVVLELDGLTFRHRLRLSRRSKNAVTILGGWTT